MAPYKVGVLGCGRISSVYAAALAALQREGVVQLVCAADKDLTRAQGFAAGFAGCAAVQTVEQLLACGPQVVHVLTPHFLHAPHTVACLEGGAHVLCEKPIAIQPADAAYMAAVAQKTGKQLGVIYQNRYIKGVRHAKQLLQGGVLGRVKAACSTLHWHRPPSYYECDWKGSWEREGGGVVIDQAIHSLDLVRYLMGCEAVRVKGSIDRRVLSSIEVEDVANAAIEFANGAVYAFSACNYYAENSPIQIELACEKGRVHLTHETVEIALDGKAPYTVLHDDATAAADKGYWGRSHELQLRDFYTCLQRGAAVPFAPQDAAKTLQLVQAIYYSSYTGNPCLLPGGLPDVVPPCL